MLDLYGERPAGDILSRSVRITLGSIEYVLPELTSGPNREWKRQAKAATIAELEGLERSGDDIASILDVLDTNTDAYLDLLISYDQSGVLPPRDVLDATAYDDEIEEAARRVWLFANPKAARLAGLTMDVPMTNGSSPPTSSPPTPTAGAPTKSKRTSRTPSSSRTSTRRATGSRTTAGRGSSHR